MKKPKYLFSANTLLAYEISQRYYNGLHYAWCAPKFGSKPIGSGGYSNPPSSRPHTRYWLLEESVQGADLHGFLIQNQRLGIQRGANLKYEAGVISLSKRDEIVQVVLDSPLGNFKPLMYIMIFEEVEHLISPPTLERYANPLSEEYIITELPGDLFEIITLEK